MTVSEVASLLSTSTQSIRNFLGDGTLTGRRGPRNWWLIDPESVEKFLALHGRLAGTRRRKSQSMMLNRELTRLRAENQRISATAVANGDLVQVTKERDDLRVKVVSLEDAVAQMRNAADLQRQAEAERSKIVEHLVSAIASGEQADALRRRAFEAIEDALARSAVPGRLG